MTLNPFDDLDRYEAMLARLPKDLLSREQETERARDGLFRFVLAGNAGGAIATLGIIVSLLVKALEKGPTATYPSKFFWIFVPFLFGLIVSAVVIAARLRRKARAQRVDYEEFKKSFYEPLDDVAPEQVKLIEGLEVLKAVEQWCVIVAGAALIVGSGLGIAVLWASAS